MGTKTIRLDDEAYDRLVTRKRDDESFSDAIKRLAGERSLMELAGILSDEEAADMRDAIAESRKSSAARMDRVVREMDRDRDDEDGDAAEDDG